MSQENVQEGGVPAGELTAAEGVIAFTIEAGSVDSAVELYHVLSGLRAPVSLGQSSSRHYQTARFSRHSGSCPRSYTQ